jgi:predicted NUDIX family NTP pyrophosphohydrolase
MYRLHDGDIEVFLVHPGGPFWSKKDQGAWSIPKGEYADGEEPLHAARREFQEETGFTAPECCLELGTIKQSGGKIVTAWSAEGNFDPDQLISNRCQLEWPPRSGRVIDFPEVDRGAWFSISEAKAHILQSQAPFLDMLSRQLHPSS